MSRPFEFCLPTKATKVSAGPEWLHEIKHDGFRLRIERDGDGVRLITRGAYDWTKRFPWIAESALENRIKQFVLDGEAVSPISTRCIPKHNEEVHNFAPLTCLRWMAMICGICRYH